MRLWRELSRLRGVVTKNSGMQQFNSAAGDDLGRSFFNWFPTVPGGFEAVCQTCFETFPKVPADWDATIQAVGDDLGLLPSHCFPTVPGSTGLERAIGETRKGQRGPGPDRPREAQRRPEKP